MKFFEHLWVRVWVAVNFAPFPCQEGVFAVLVCRVTMGKMNVTSSDTEAGEKVKRMEYDSTCGKRVLSALWITEWMSQNVTRCVVVTLLQVQDAVIIIVMEWNMYCKLLKHISI